ncbi:Na+/H+ antiporter NhaC family protein [Petroclostridium sp. X23]|uniref:Na+/H+ antiporter NhaC family protein n=1 Tax=Petroclostridium sp. X23 TaxID=3045146 RepID=UPI0024ADF23F|nr:Na+/H+ antiporter NhaC family protein [Petroclostridium sp. X23]WHH59947.1 Na+/H+ antiporter NhaC family protein [Petroclostridium sp. X23]
MTIELILSVMPPLAAIILALITRQVIPSLLIGLWIGSFIASPGFISSIATMADYIVNTLSDRGNLDVLLFLYAFSGLVAVIELSGGVQGFAKFLSRLIRSKRGALLGLWALIPITFIDCGFRVVATGSIMKPIIQKQGISRERFAYMLNNSASPVVAIIPIATTFVGYMVGVVASGLQVAGSGASPYIIFLQSIPFNFFSLASFGVVLLSVLGILNFRVMKKMEEENPKDEEVEERSKQMTGQPDYQDQLTTKQGMGMTFAAETGQEISPDIHEQNLKGPKDDRHTEHGQMNTEKKHNEVHHTGQHKEHGDMHMDHEMGQIDMNIEPRPWNLIVPIMVIIPLSFYLMWWSGRGKGRNTLLDIFSNADSSRAMLLALLITTMVSFIFYRFQGIHLKEMVSRFVKGGNRLMMTIAILAVAWPIARVSKDLGLPKLITMTIGNTLPAFLVPVTVFLITAAVTFFIGSSWGTWALTMPLAIPLAVVSGAFIPMTVGAVFAGGTFGDVSSPLSGMGAMASGIAEVEHMDYITAQMPYNLLAAALAAVAFLVVPLIM